MLLIIISPPENIPNEQKIVVALFYAGLPIFHLRKPTFSADEMEKYILGIPTEFHQRMVLHSHYPLALKYDLKGIHLSEKMKNDQSIDNLSDDFRHKSISASFHSLEDVKQNPKKYDYLFLSPVFDSISKCGYKSNFSLDTVDGFLNAKPAYTNIPVIALGGVSEAHIRLIKNTGFAGAALLCAIWGPDDPVLVFAKIKYEADK